MRAPGSRPRYRRVLGVLATVALVGCGGDDAQPAAPDPPGDPGAIHVHGLGVDPADDSLFVATHTGLFRAGASDTHARRVGDRYQDTMGFTVVGPRHFLGSGHPDGRDDLPPFLGLIETRDAGLTWRSVSLLGEVDFHVLEASGSRIYGFGTDWETRQGRFLTSADRGRTWRRLQAPEPLTSLAISPTDPRALTISGEQGVYRSSNAGRSWASVAAPSAGFVAWMRDELVLIGLEGLVWRAAGDVGSGQWRPMGTVGGPPAAVDTTPDGGLLVAMHDGLIQQSSDTGRTWTVRSQP